MLTNASFWKVNCCPDAEGVRGFCIGLPSTTEWCSSQLVSYFEECSPGVILNCDFHFFRTWWNILYVINCCWFELAISTAQRVMAGQMSHLLKPDKCWKSSRLLVMPLNTLTSPYAPKSQHSLGFVPINTSSKSLFCSLSKAIKNVIYNTKIVTNDIIMNLNTNNLALVGKANKVSQTCWLCQ